MLGDVAHRARGQGLWHRAGQRRVEGGEEGREQMGDNPGLSPRVFGKRAQGHIGEAPPCAAGMGQIHSALLRDEACGWSVVGASRCPLFVRSETTSWVDSGTRCLTSESCSPAY